MADRGEGKSRRGFASMDESRQREIASKGGRAAHAKGTAHEFDSSEARAAGRKGGEAVSRNREHMAAIGRKGGEARGTSARNSTRGASARQGSEAPRSADAVRGTVADSRGGAADVYRSAEGRGDSGRASSARLNDQDRSEQLRADEFPADQARNNGRNEREIAGNESEPRNRNASENRI